MDKEKWKQAVKQKIEEAAKSGCLLYYDELLPSEMEISMEISKGEERARLYPVLDEINDESWEKEQILLSALVIGKEIGMPGEGFFRKNKEKNRFLAQFSLENRFTVFAREARKAISRYNKTKNNGVIIDADQVGGDTAARLLDKINLPVVCRAYGNDANWLAKKRKRLGVDFFHTPEKEYRKNELDIKNATDFRLYAQTVVAVREIHNKRLIDDLYIISCDKGFKHLVDTVREDGVEVEWLDNQGEKHNLG